MCQKLVCTTEQKSDCAPITRVIKQPPGGVSQSRRRFPHPTEFHIRASAVSISIGTATPALVPTCSVWSIASQPVATGESVDDVGTI